MYMDMNREIIEAKKRGEERPLHNSDFITLEEAICNCDSYACHPICAPNCPQKAIELVRKDGK